jgi:hypothetical protein
MRRMIIVLRSKGEEFTVTFDDEDADLIVPFNWSVSSGKYCVRWKDGKMISLHREILGLKHGDKRRGDHINGDTFDNHRSNLRICTVQQNLWGYNRPTKGTTTSKHRGVLWEKRRSRWRVEVTKDRKAHFGGYFLDEDEAAERARELRHELYGEFAVQ